MEKIDVASVLDMKDGEDYAACEGVQYIDGKKKNGAKFDVDIDDWKETREYCEGCKYRSLNDKACDYMFVTGERRGCKAGEGCTRKVEGKRDPQRLVLRGKMQL